MKRNLMPLIAVAFIAAVAATGIFYGLLLPRLGKPSQRSSGGAVVAAGRAMPKGYTLKPEDLITTGVPEGWRGTEGFGDKELVAGLTLLQPVSSRQPIEKAFVSPRGQAGGASLAVPAGMRAVTIHPVGSVGIVNLLEAGSRIDIHVIDARARESGPVLRRLIGDLEVLGKSGDSSHPEVTVLAGVGEAERLLLADSSLPLRIALRNPGDRAQEGNPAVGPADLFDKAASEPRVRAALQ